MRRGAQPVVVTMGATSGIGAMFVVIVAVVGAVRRQDAPPLCEGIGWGCEPSWRSVLVALVGLVVAVIVAATGTVAAVGLSRAAVGRERALRWQWRASRLAIATVAFVAVASLALSGV